MGLYPVTVGVSNLQIIGTCDLITKDTPQITQFLKRHERIAFFKSESIMSWCEWQRIETN